jgi:transcriptional regulator with XRE-family HTH domain
MCRMFLAMKSVGNGITIDNAAIGARLAAARKAAKLTQGELAERAGWGNKEEQVGQKRISAYERGQNGLGIAELLTLAEILNLDPWDLAGVKKQQVKQRK